jgi:large subunit ribosomal protein L10
MPKSREEKQKIIEDLKEKLQREKAIVLVNFSGLDSKALATLREDFKKLNGCFQVVKKTLLKKALESLGWKKLLQKIEEIAGQLALGFGFDDEIVPAKICYKYSQENKNLKILGGFLGNEFVEKEKVIELAKLPSREEILARLVGSLHNPISKFVNVLQSNIKGLIFAIEAIKQTK